MTTCEVCVEATPEEPEEPASEFIASDDFGRTVTGSWGTADVGGGWTLSGGAASAASVADGVGKLTLGANSTRNMQLAGVSAKDVTLSVDFSVDTAPTTGAAYVGVIARASSADNYTVRSWLHSNGSVWLVVQQGSTVITSYQVPGLTRSAGDTFTLEVSVSGGTSTTISAKIWKSGTAEPANWQVTTVDATGIDAAGAVGLHANRVSSATSSTVVSFDAFRVTDNG